MPRNRLFRAGCYLAVLASDEDDAGGDKFWICYNKTDVYLDNDNMTVSWLEKVKFS